MLVPADVEVPSPINHWGRVTHICVIKLAIIGSENGLSPSRRQAIIWTNVGILLIGPWGANFSDILIEILTFSFKKMYLKMSSGKWRPFCLGLNVLTHNMGFPVGYLPSAGTLLSTKQDCFIKICLVFNYFDQIFADQMVSLKLSWRNCWTSSRVACDLRSNAHVKSP